MRNTPKITQYLMSSILQSPKMGALPTLRAATDPASLGGQFYGPSGKGQIRGMPKVVTSSDDSYQKELQETIWDLSEKLTGFHYNL